MAYHPTGNDLEEILSKLDSWVVGYSREKSKQDRSLDHLNEIERNLFFYFNLVLYIHPPEYFDVGMLIKKFSSRRMKTQLTKKLYQELVEPAIKHLKRFLYNDWKHQN